MKERLILTTFGLVLGLGLTALAYPVIQRLGGDLPEGARFESIEDFQRAMLKRDKRDLKPDQSVSLRTIISPHPSDLVMYDLIPGLEVKFQGVPVKMNSCGMRDPERQVEKPSDVYRIALLGDSFVFGWGVEQHEGFAQVTEQILNDLVQGVGRVEVLNFGVPGYSTFQEVALFEDRGLDFDPDAILVFFVENDFGLPFFVRDIHQAGKMISSHRFAKKSWAKDDPDINKQNQELLRHLDSNRALIRLRKLGDERGIPTFVTINPNRQFDKIKRQLWALRKKHQLQSLQIREEFLEIIERRKIDPKTLSLPNDPHPSALKHRILGELLAAGLFPSVIETLELRNPHDEV